MNTGHWISPQEFDPKQYHGFVYEVTEKSTGMKYIGKTSFWRVHKKKPTKFKLNDDGSFVKDATGKRILNTRTTRTHSRVETEWRTYRTSNSELQKKIAERPEDYTLKILYLGTGVMDVKIKEAYVQIQYYMNGRWNELYNKQIDLRGQVPAQK